MNSQIKSAVAITALFLLPTMAVAQVATPGLPLLPLGYCSLSASQLESAVGLSSCVRASFTGSGSGASLTASSVSGEIKIGDAVSGTGVPSGTTVLSQLSGTPGGAGVYQTSEATTSSSASLTSGGIPPGATLALISVETADVYWRDDGAAPTTSIGMPIAFGAAPFFYAGTMSAIEFIAQSGSPVVDVSFYRSP